MNSNDKNLQAKTSQDELVLLCEGELSTNERVLLLQKMDLDPTAWKRCALILLQNNALKTSFAALPIESTKSRSDAPASMHTFLSKDRNPWQIVKPLSRRSVIAGSAITVSLILLFSGFGMGWLAKPESDLTAEESSQPGDPIEDRRGLANSLRQQDPDLVRRIQFAVNSVNVDDSEIIALVGIQETEKTNIYPVIRSRELQRQMTALPQPHIPEKFANRLRNSGWRMQAHRHFVLLELPDGNKKTFPVELLNYQYVGKETL